MALRKNNDTVNEQAEFLGGLFDGGSMEIYSGSQPADPNDSPSGTLLVQIDIPSPAFGAAVGGTIAKAGTWQEVAVGTGTAGWARLISADTNKSLDISVSEAGGGGNAIISEENVIPGNTITVASFSLTSPAL
jgi:hypothetical protein